MNKDKIIRIIVIVGILLCILGIMNKIFEFTIFNFFKNMTKPYLERAYEESKKLFITLSLLKGTTDVIEGSTVNVNVILGMNIQIGDLVQPIYDIIDILWKISLASVVVLKLETIYYEIFKMKLASILIFISLVTYLPYTFSKNMVTEALKKISKYTLLGLTFIYILLPGTILLSSAMSDYFEKEYKEPAVVRLNQSLDKLNKVKDDLFVMEQSKNIFNIPGQIESTKNKFSNLGQEISNVSKDLADFTPVIIGITLLSYIIMPLLLLIFLYKLTKSQDGIYYVEKNHDGNWKAFAKLTVKGSRIIGVQYDRKNSSGELMTVDQKENEKYKSRFGESFRETSFSMTRSLVSSQDVNSVGGVKDSGALSEFKQLVNFLINKANAGEQGNFKM